jgi:hypothetical protein
MKNHPCENCGNEIPDGDTFCDTITSGYMCDDCLTDSADVLDYVFYTFFDVTELKNDIDFAYYNKALKFARVLGLDVDEWETYFNKQLAKIEL